MYICFSYLVQGVSVKAIHMIELKVQGILFPDKMKLLGGGGDWGEKEATGDIRSGKCNEKGDHKLDM